MFYMFNIFITNTLNILYNNLNIYIYLLYIIKKINNDKINKIDKKIIRNNNKFSIIVTQQQK